MVTQHTKAKSNSTFAAASHSVQEAIEKPVELAREYPMASMLIVFGVGLGVGVIFSQFLCSSTASFLHEPTFAERLSRQINDAVHQVLPESLAKQLDRFQQ